MAATAALAAAILAVFVAHLRGWQFTCDDAYIAFRYARNWAEHGEPVFNVSPLERVEGYTSFLLVAILTVGQLVGVAPHELAPAIGVLGSIACLLLVTWVARELRRRGPRGVGDGRLAPIDLVAAGVLVVMPEFVVWASGGLETSLAVALGLAAVLAWLRGRVVLAAGWAAALGLTRLDGLLWIAVFGLAWLTLELFARARSGGLRVREVPWSRVGVATLVFVAPLLVHALWRHDYYGEWLPNTWTIKSGGRLLRDSWGTAYVAQWSDAVRLLACSPLLLLVRARHLLTIAAMGGSLFYAWWIGGDFMAYSRFLLPATVMWALTLGWVVGDLRRLVERHTHRRIPVAELVGLALVALFAQAIPGRRADDHAHAHLDGRWEGVQAMDQFARVRVAAGEVMGRELDAGTWVAVGAAGAMPYASRLPAFDSYGLVDPGVAAVATFRADERARPGHQLQAPLAYVRGRNPDLMCHLGSDGTRRPRRREASDRAGPGWAWECFETGAIADARSPGGWMESRFYCCLRPADRPLRRRELPAEASR